MAAGVSPWLTTDPQLDACWFCLCGQRGVGGRGGGGQRLLPSQGVGLGQGRPVLGAQPEESGELGGVWGGDGAGGRAQEARDLKLSGASSSVLGPRQRTVHSSAVWLILGFELGPQCCHSFKSMGVPTDHPSCPDQGWVRPVLGRSCSSPEPAGP